MQTSTTQHGSARRRTAAAASYVAALAALALASLWFVDDLLVRSDEVETARAQLAGLNSHFKVALRQSSGAGARLPFIEGRTVTIAGASLQERLALAVANAGGALVSLQIDLDGPDAKNGFIGLIANVEIGQPQLQALLYDLEAGMPLLFVDTLSIQSPELFGEHETGRMRVALGVAGQWRGAQR